MPELPGCATDGPSYQEAIANVEVITDEWIEVATEMGWTISTPLAFAGPSTERSHRPSLPGPPAGEGTQAKRNGEGFDEE